MFTLKYNIEIYLYNYIPYYDRPILFNSGNNENLLAHPNTKLDFHIPSASFSDIDGSYDQISIKVKGNGIKFWPKWLIFDALSQKLTGTPKLQDLK